MKVIPVTELSRILLHKPLMIWKGEMVWLNLETATHHRFAGSTTMVDVSMVYQAKKMALARMLTLNHVPSSLQMALTPAEGVLRVKTVPSSTLRCATDP